MTTNTFSIREYQTHFRRAAKTAAETILNALDPNLAPEVFLVGMREPDQGTGPAACLEPEDCGYHPDQFTQIIADASRLEAVDDERLSLYSDPLRAEHRRSTIQQRAIQNVLQDTVTRFQHYGSTALFCSIPVMVNNYYISVVLQVQRQALSSHYSLNKSVVGYNIALARSLLDVVMSEYLTACADALAEPHPGIGMNILLREPEEFIRAAGKFFMYTPAWAGGNRMGLSGLFKVCNEIAIAKYEGNDGRGSILIAKPGHTNIETTIKLRAPVPMSNCGAVRKLLEISSRGVSLLSDSAQVYALGRGVGRYDSNNKDLFEVRFVQQGVWELIHAERILMRCSYGQPMLPQGRIEREKFFDYGRRVFHRMPERALQALWEIVVEAAKQRHGTMVVISDEAAAEARRLSGQATIIEPVALTPSLVSMVTAIDGAVLIDPRGICHAIGVILDGIASTQGNPARGARYNSAVRYADSHNNCLIVVISEDGLVDLLPDLKPQPGRGAAPEA